MDELKYENKIYTRRSGKWTDSSYAIVPVAMQKILNREFAKNLDISDMSVEQLVAEGDNFKKSTSYTLAIKYYEEVLLRCDEKELAYILPRLSSCYRKKNTPEKAIEIFKYGKCSEELKNVYTRIEAETQGRAGLSHY